MSDDRDPNVYEDVKERHEDKVKKPDLFNVILHNDDYTTMEFVVEVLVNVFHKDIEASARIMLDVHRKGQGKAGSYTYDIAVTKVTQVTEMARAQEFPLRCTMQPA